MNYSEIYDHMKKGLNPRILIKALGMPFDEFNRKMRDQFFSTDELTTITKAINKWERENKSFQQRS